MVKLASIASLCSPCCVAPLTPAPHHLHCSHCGNAFPLLRNGLALLVAAPERLLSQTVAALKKERLVAMEALLKLQKHIRDTPSVRLEHLTQIYQASSYNVKGLSSLLATMSTTSKDQDDVIEDALKGSYARFATCVNYMRRDWSDLPESHREIAAIETRVADLISKHAADCQTALVLGAGTGRFAYDLSNLFQQTLALDYSITMGCVYQKLLQQDVDFYSVNLKNARENKDQIECIQASIKHASTPASSHHLPTYVIADACHIPMESQSVSVVLSIYFTDVLPMSQWWPEVMRVLRPGGVFIHFGPLQYHFNSLHDNYSAADLRAYIQAKQFEICDEQWTLSQHLGRAFQRFAPTYDHWSFAEIKHGLQPDGSNVG